MTWSLLFALVVVLAIACAASWHRRSDLRRQQRAVAERADAAKRGSEVAPLQVPVIDLARCLGCGTCVTACPESGVLALVHGQAAVVNPAGCVGHARCVAECPVGAVTLTQGDLAARRDVPALDAELQAIGGEGVFLVGEITARSLIRVAAEQGQRVAATIAARATVAAGGGGGDGDEVLDAVIVGAGPGGFACALGCREHGLAFALLDQEASIGGTVAKYPRQKLVLTDDVALPLYGHLPQREYAKEELIELWQRLADEHELPFTGGVTFDHVERADDGTLVVHTDAGTFRARHVVIAVGRRGSPRRLGVAGEELPHVAYSLLDAANHQGEHCVVVGGGDSAVEAALALAEQPGNTVTIVYRQDAFVRIRSKNRTRITERIAAGRVRTLFEAQVGAITADHVVVAQRTADGERRGKVRADRVFVMIGGTPPFAQLERSGVSFDPEQRQAPAPLDEPARTPSLLPALAAGLLATAATLGFALWHHDYYGLSTAERAADPKHALLRPDRSLGLWFGFAAAAAVLANLTYLLRRNQWFGVRFGPLPWWMTAHVGTGVAALLLAMLHAALAPRETAGGYAFWALLLLLATGAVGRWFYAWLPRTANGRELELTALRGELAAAQAQAQAGGSAFARAAFADVQALLDRRQWRSTLPGRVMALVGLQWDLWRTQRRLRHSAAAAGITAGELADVLARTRATHDAAVAVAHLEDLRALLGTWRWLHRWLALLMVLLILVHVALAIAHGALSGGGFL